jgi:hypothetical protein
MNDEPTARQPGSGEAKAPYSTPRLAVYGDLRVITENMTMTGADGGHGASNKSG